MSASSSDDPRSTAKSPDGVSDNRHGHAESPNGAATCQPRATPWVGYPKNPSPEGAAHRRNDLQMRVCFALSGLDVCFIGFPGRCPGLIYFAPLGLEAARV